VRPSSLQWGYVKFSTRSHCDLIRVYNAAAHMIETHEHAVDFKE
jgi:hypothetical protein